MFIVTGGTKKGGRRWQTIVQVNTYSRIIKNYLIRKAR